MDSQDTPFGTLLCALPTPLRVIRGASKTPVFQPAVGLYRIHSFSPLALFLERNMGAIKHEVPVWTGAPASPMAPLPLCVPAAVSLLLVMI